MKDIKIVNDLEAIKTLSDPLRLKILELLIDHQATVKQISTSLGLSSANVHYHVKELEKQALIELVETAEKGGILEKYYRAVANNFYIDHSLGKHNPEQSTAAEAFSREIMRRRREEHLQVDLERLCDRITNYCLSVRRGEVVRISGGFHQQELLEAMYASLIKAGAKPIVTVSSDLMKLAQIELSYKHTGTVLPDLFYNWLSDFQVAIFFDELVDPSLFSALTAEHVDLVARTNRMFDMRMNELGIRCLRVSYPTRRKAEHQGIDYAALYDTYWKALDIDYAEMRSLGRKLRDRLQQAENLTITGPFTNLSVKLAKRVPWVDDGVISANDLASSHNFSTLPAGQICVAPREGTAEGKALFHSATYRGQILPNIMMEFKQGEVVSISAEKESDAAAIRDLLFLPVEDDRRKLGVFSMGFNPEVLKPLGSSIIDHKAYGSARIAIGANDLYGGENVSAITWSFLLLNCRVELDGDVILDQGRYTL